MKRSALNTRTIIRDLQYQLGSGKGKSLSSSIERSVVGTRLIHPSRVLEPLLHEALYDTQYSVANESMLVAAKRFSISYLKQICHAINVIDLMAVKSRALRYRTARF